MKKIWWCEFAQQGGTNPAEQATCMELGHPDAYGCGYRYLIKTVNYLAAHRVVWKLPPGVADEVEVVLADIIDAAIGKEQDE